MSEVNGKNRFVSFRLSCYLNPYDQIVLDQFKFPLIKDS